MIRTKKTVFAAILSMLVIAIGLAVFFVFPTSAASSGTCGATANDGGAESVSWTLDDSGVLTISVPEGSAGGAMADYTMGKAPWYASRTSITSIVVGDGITNIGKYAFYNCTAVTKATFGKNVTSIGGYAFQQCTKLATVTFNGNVTSIGDYAFNSCSLLSTVSFGSVEATANALVIPDTVTSIGNNAFNGCRSFTSAELPLTITEVPGYLFNGCTRLTSVTLKGKITSIGSRAFYECEALNTLQFGDTAATAYKLVIPESVTSFGTKAFGYTLFTSADLTATSLTELPASIFDYCMSLKEIYLPQEMTSIGSEAFWHCYALVILQWEGGKTATAGVIEIPEGVKLGASAFRDCSAVKEVILPSTLTEIPNYLFYNCENTEKITFNGDITAIGNYAFGNDSAIATVENLNHIDFNGNVSTNGALVLPEYLKTIGSYAFQYNGSVKSVVIPEGVTSIGSSAFRYCTNLEKATFYSTGATVGTDAFMNCSATFSVELPYLCSDAGAMEMRAALINSGVSAGAVKLNHTDADNDGCCDVTTCYDSKENGYIIVSGGVKDVDYTYSGGLLTVIKNGTYTLSSSHGETAIEESIVVSAGLDNVTLILNGLNILTTDASNAILVDSSEELPTKVTITLAKGSANTLKSGVGSALVGGDCAVVTINGEGSLTATGGNNTSTSSKTGGGAGIEMYSEAVLIIDSGTVTANGGNGYNGGPGIGVSRTGIKRSVYIINGGTVTANGGATTCGKSTSYGAYNGPGFGGSRVVSNAYHGGAYVVNGGTLVATGGIYEGAAESTRGAGIGNYCLQVQLISGVVTATGGSSLGDIYMYASSSNSTYYSYWNTIVNLTLTNDKINLNTKVKSAVIDSEAKTITIPSVTGQNSPYLDHYVYFCFYGDLVVPDGYTLMGGNLTLCYNSSLTVAAGASVDGFSSINALLYSKGMKFAKWLCPYEGVRSDEDLSSYPHGENVTGEEYAKIYSTFSIKSIYHIELGSRADLRPITQTYTGLPITIDFKVSSLDASVVFVEGYDYTLTYNNNILPGTASYTITPLEGGRMIGDPVTVEFTIAARSLTINKPTTAHMQVGGNALDVLPKGASAIYLMIDQTPQEIQNGKFTWYVDAERTTLLTNEHGAALAAGEHTVYWTYHHEHKGFENDLTGETTLYVTEKAPQQIEIDGVGVIDGVIPLFNKGGVTTTTVKFDLHPVITVNGAPITDFGGLTWTVNGIAPVDGVSTYVLDDDGSVSVDQNGLLTIVGMTTETVTLTLTAAETESYAEGSGQITVKIHPAGFHLSFDGSAGGTGGSSGSTGPQTITISGVTVDHKIYDGVAVSHDGTPTATLSDGTTVTPTGQYTFTYYKQTGTDEGDALDYTPYAVGNYWLIITYSDASYKGEYKTEFIIAHREIHVQPDGTLPSGTLVGGHTVDEVVTDAATGAITRVVIENAEGDDVSANYLVIFVTEKGEVEHTCDHSGNTNTDNGVCTVCGNLNATLVGSNLTLEGNIGLNFYFELDAAIVNSSTALVRFTLADGRVINIPVSEGKRDITTVEGKTLYVFTCEVYAKQMADTVTAQVIMGENESVEYPHSVVGYAKTIIANAENKYTDEEIALVKAMLNYGANAQLNFGYNTENLANAGLTETEKPLSSVTAETFNAYKVTAKTVDGIGTFVGSDLVLESETTLNVYFKPAYGVNIDDLTFTVGDVTVTPVQSGEYYVISITNITSSELDEAFTITVSNGTASGTFSCSVFAYCYNVLSTETNDTYTEKLKDTLKALYLYNAAANTYFNSEE